MTVTETYKKALICFEDFIPDFCDKLVQDGVISEGQENTLAGELFTTLSDFIVEYYF